VTRENLFQADDDHSYCGGYVTRGGRVVAAAPGLRIVGLTTRAARTACLREGLTVTRVRRSRLRPLTQHRSSP
jgi:hypothetical protein